MRTYKKRTFTGLRTYVYTFDSIKAMQAWRDKNEYRATIVELFINNGYALEVRFHRQIG